MFENGSIRKYDPTLMFDFHTRDWHGMILESPAQPSPAWPARPDPFSLQQMVTSTLVLIEEVSAISFVRQQEYDKDFHYIQYLIYPWKYNTEDFDTSASTERLPPCNLWFADDIDLLGSGEEALQQLTERLHKTAAGYGMDISSRKKSNTPQPY